MRLYGRNPVIERLRSYPQSISKIYIQEGLKGSSFVRSKARQKGIPVFVVAKSKLIKIARNANTQGIVCDVCGFEYIEYAELLESARKKKRTLIFIDGITDPQNLGSIIRSLACLGGFAVVLPTHDTVDVTESVLRVASGGENHVPVAKVKNLNQAIKKAKQEGFTIVGTIVEEGEDLNNVKFPSALGVVVGSEQKGIRDVVRKQIDQKIKIPMHTHTLSLNVAQATAIVGYEITRQKKRKEN